MRGGVPITLQQSSGGAWKVVARTQTGASAAFSLRYTAPGGTVRLRVHFAGDAGNAAATRLLPACRALDGRLPVRACRAAYFTRILTRSDRSVRRVEAAVTHLGA